jgi:transposase InsO family protein
VEVERVMTDNGSPYISTIHAATCRELGIRHLRTQPYRSQTNGKAERFIQTMLREGPTDASMTYRQNEPASPLDRATTTGTSHSSLGHRPAGGSHNEL